MNGVRSGKPVCSPPLQLFNCAHADCGATFTRQWRLKEHETVHTGARPCLCTIAGCGRRFSRKSHLSRHMLHHRGVKQFQCKFASCTQSFIHAGKLKRHVRYAHGDKTKYFKCTQPNCSSTFKKRRLFKLHLKEHGSPAKFKYVCVPRTDVLPRSTPISPAKPMRRSTQVTAAHMLIARCLNAPGGNFRSTRQNIQLRSRAKCARRCLRKWMLCGDTSGSTLPISLCWFVPGTTARPTSPLPLTCSTTSARCTSSSSNTDAPSPTAHAYLLCGRV